MAFNFNRSARPNFYIPAQRSFKLTQDVNTFQVSLPFACVTVILLNTTPNPFYLSRGSRYIPTAQDASSASVYVCPPAVGGVPGQLQLPMGLVSEFGGFVPNSPALGDTFVTVTFNGWV